MEKPHHHERRPEDHQQFMPHCRRLAGEAALTGNSPVGAVIVRDGTIIGEGREATRPHQDVTCHAEVEAIRDAVRRTGAADLSGCCLYSTHEPCILCAYVIRHHRLAMVVFDAITPNVGGFSSPYPILTTTGISVWGPPPAVLQLMAD